MLQLDEKGFYLRSATAAKPARRLGVTAQSIEMVHLKVLKVLLRLPTSFLRPNVKTFAPNTVYRMVNLDASLLASH